MKEILLSDQFKYLNKFKGLLIKLKTCKEHKLQDKMNKFQV